MNEKGLIEAVDFRRALKVKVIHLAYEAKVIRREEGKSKVRLERLHLELHRKGPLRAEARAAQLAYAFLRGTPYRSVEKMTLPENLAPRKRVEDLVAKYGVPPWSYSSAQDSLRKEVAAWFDVE